MDTEKAAKANWQVTATTIHCEEVGEEVTLLIYGDGTAKCTGAAKYAGPDKVTSRALKKKSRLTGKTLSCVGPGCRHIIEYKRKWNVG
jgi:hypothetical protein